MINEMERRRRHRQTKGRAMRERRARYRQQGLARSTVNRLVRESEPSYNVPVRRAGILRELRVWEMLLDSGTLNEEQRVAVQLEIAYEKRVLEHATY